MNGSRFQFLCIMIEFDDSSARKDLWTHDQFEISLRHSTKNVHR